MCCALFRILQLTISGVDLASVSAPNFFLKVTERLVEQLKMREYFVARIILMMERVVDTTVRKASQV